MYKISEFSGGQTFADTECRVVPAGKGLNVARVVRTLGEEVGVCGLLPECDARRIVSVLDDSDIAHSFISIPGSIRINATVIETNREVSTHISSLSYHVPQRIQNDFLELMGAKMREGDYWCFSGSLPEGFSNDIYGDMIQAGHRVGVKTLLDTRHNALKLGVRARPLILKPNLTELEEFFDESIKGVRHIALRGKRLLDMGVGYVFISLGADGMIALHDNDCLLCSAPTVKVVDTVGCGDALVAGVLVAMKRQFSFTETCRMAVACGCAKAMCGGPGSIDAKAVGQLMELVDVKSV